MPFRVISCFYLSFCWLWNIIFRTCSGLISFFVYPISLNSIPWGCSISTTPVIYDILNSFIYRINNILVLAITSKLHTVQSTKTTLCLIVIGNLYADKISFNFIFVVILWIISMISNPKSDFTYLFSVLTYDYFTVFTVTGYLNLITNILIG